MNAYTTSPDTPADKGRLLIVDDDPIAGGMLGVMLKKHGYEVKHVPSGEACLATMAEFSPEVVLLDIEMPGGIDGYETCQRLRAQFERTNLTVIFLSGHDTLEERLRAYDVGGDDFVAKPFDAEEIRRKIALAVRSRIARKQLIAEKVSLEETADIAMQGYNEMGAVVQFTRGALGCRTLKALAEQIIDSMRILGSICHVQLRGSAAAGIVTLTPDGPASPLEESVIERMSTQDRIFQFKSRMIVNYENVSVLVANMPTDDPALAGRIRDYLAIVAEAAEDAVANISLRADAVERAKELRLLAEIGRNGIEMLQSKQHDQLADTRCAMERMVEVIESLYYQFGLTTNQEEAISETVHAAKDELLALFERYQSNFDQQFTVVLDGLNRASEYQIETEEVVAPITEVWL